MSDSGYVFRKEKTSFTKEVKSDRGFNLNYRDSEHILNNPEMAGKISRSMKLKEQKGGLKANVYGDRFKEKLSAAEREKARKKSGSELYKKAESKRLILGADEEYEKRFDKQISSFKKLKGFSMEGLEYDFDDVSHLFHIGDNTFNKKIWKEYQAGGEHRFSAMDMLLEDFVNQDYNFDLSTDEAIAAGSLRFIQMKERADHFLSLITRNMDYWASIDEDSRTAVMEKIAQAEHLHAYYTKRKELITDAYYSTHLDSEMSYVNFEADRIEDMRRNQEVIRKLQESELAYENLLHMDEKDREEKVALSMRQKQEDQSVIGNLAAPKGKVTKSKSEGFKLLDIFGLPLKAFSYLMRKKRTAEHGRKRYDEEVRALEKFPEQLTYIGKEGKTFIRDRGQDAPAPRIELNPLFTDPVKLRISELIKDEDGYTVADETSKQDVVSAGIYTEFIKAADNYAKIGGIVNADTTEMEMAFLDRLTELGEEYEKKFSGEIKPGTPIEKRLTAMRAVLSEIRTSLSGNLKNVIDQETFEGAVRNSTAIIQYTGIDDNMDDSNIVNIPLFTHFPNINDIKQSTIGDCYLVGAMTSFVKTSPQGVLNMFQDLGDGNVLVRLYDGFVNGERLDSTGKWFDAATHGNAEMKPVFVKLRKHYETGDGNANDCVWPQLLEKAYAAAGFNMKGEAKVDEKGYLYDIEKELTCGHGYIALSHLSGTVHKKTGVTSSITKERGREIKDGMADFLRSDGYRGLLGAGIPRYFMDAMFDSVSDNELKLTDQDNLMYRFEIAVRFITTQFGTKLMQIRREFEKKRLTGADYHLVVNSLAEKLGLPLKEGWDGEAISVARNIHGKQEFIYYDPFEDNQRWDYLFSPDFGKAAIERFKQNFENIKNGQPVTYDTVKGMDTLTFAYDEIETLLDGIIDMTREANEKDELAARQQDMLDRIDATLNFSGNQGTLNEVIRDHGRTQQQFFNEHKEEARRYTLRMMLPFHETVDENMLDFAARLKEVLDKGGSMEISINHFISAVGMEYYRGEWFVLIKDPFNVYNMSYENDENGVLTKKEDSFLDVLSLEGFEKKRYLNESGDYNENIHGGFRGLSYWKLTDLYKKMKDYTPILPNEVK